MNSMWSKHKLRQKQNILCNGNRDIGYIPIDDDSIHRIGLRGRKANLFYLLFGLLGLITLLNTILNLFLFFTYKLYNANTAPLDFWSDPNKVIFNRDAYISKLIPADSEISSYYEKDLKLLTDNHNDITALTKYVEPARDKRSNYETNQKLSFTFNSNQTMFQAVDQFALVKAGPREKNKAENVYFSGFMNDKNLPFQPDHIALSRVYTSKVSCPDDNGDGEIIIPPSSVLNQENYKTMAAQPSTVFKITSDGPFVRLKGNQGITLTTTKLDINASNDITIRSKEGSIYLNSPKGQLYFPTRYLPFQGFVNDPAFIKQAQAYKAEYGTHKLCICLPSGKLFTVPVLNTQTNCLNGVAQLRVNPCPD